MNEVNSLFTCDLKMRVLKNTALIPVQNQGQNIWKKVNESRNTGHYQNSLTSDFQQFLPKKTGHQVKSPPHFKMLPVFLISKDSASSTFQHIMRQLLPKYFFIKITDKIFEKIYKLHIKQRTTGKVQFLVLSNLLLELIKFSILERDWALGCAILRFS